MIANTSLQVAGLNFDEIGQSIKDYISSKPEFLDYNFEGSTISLLIDALAYNTYLNSFYLNMAVNENFLDTAQIRENVVSLAKHLGYVPRSAKSARASITINFSPIDSPDYIVIPKYTRFKSTKAGIDYIFSTLEETSAPNDLGAYAKTLLVYEGEPIEQTFTYIEDETFYTLLNSNIDVDTIEVQVLINGGPSATTYSRAGDITEITSTSTVYFLQEAIDGKYELRFGDGILGVMPDIGDIIKIRYLVSSGSVANGLTRFSNISFSGYNPDVTTTKYLPSSVSLVERSNGGQERETIESIKFNAPRYYMAQNRAVTSEDYKTFILNRYSFIQSINVWGGEEHIPPIYGRVILSIKPFGGYSLPELRKNSIVSDMKRLNVMSIEPIIIDPIFVYINPTIIVRYDSNKTTQSPENMFGAVQTTVANFELNQLSVFGNSFYYSQFLETITRADSAIISAETDILLEKRIAPILESTITYKLRFDTEIRNPYAGYLGAVSSTGFTLANNPNVQFIDDDGNGNIRIYYLNALQQKVYTNNKAGTVNYETGDIVLNAFRVVSLQGDEIRVFVEPKEKDYTPLRNQVVLLSHPRLSVLNIRTNQITKGGILDVFGNLSPLFNNSIDIPITL